MCDRRITEFGFINPVYGNYLRNWKGEIMAWKEREDSVFKFEKEGDFIEGVLTAITESGTYDNKVYKLKQDDGKIVSVFSTTVMATKMATVAIGEKVKIEYTGEKENKNKGQSPTKQFKIYVDE